MPLTAAGGPFGPGTGPVPLSALFSDRTGEGIGDGSAAASVPSPMSHVLRTLDEISAAELESVEGLRSIADPTAPSAADPAARSAVPGLDEQPVRPRSETSSRREEILDAASTLFAERGYHGASLRDISRIVGISHPGMLHHFPSKEALLSAVIDRLEAHAQGLLDSVEVLQNSPQSLVAALQGPWDPREHSMALLSTLSAEVVNPSHPGRYRIARLRLVHEHVLEQVLAGLARNGRIADRAEPTFLARTLFSLLLSLTVRERTVRELQNTSLADPIEDVQLFVRSLVEG